jgi:hypothetical protein
MSASFCFKILGLTCLIAGLGLGGCKRETELFEMPLYDHSPLDSGKYLIYSLDTVLYNDFSQTVDTHSYQLKVQYGRRELDATGKLFTRVEHYLRTDSSQNWVLSRVFAAQNDSEKYYTIENNQRIIRLAYPIQKNTTWDGLVHIRRDTSIDISGVGGAIAFYKDWEDFKYTNTDVPATIGGRSYTSVSTVLQVDEINRIERRYVIEQYAKGVGLVHKEMLILDTQCSNRTRFPRGIESCANVDWAIKAEKGIIVRQTLLDTNF